MNYRHAYHAGNFADVVKHLALVAALTYLRKKDAPFAVIDTHAGRGRYDLAGDEAQRTGEAADGISRLRDISAGPDVLTSYLDLAGRGHEYPGSPLLAAKLLRPKDRLVAVEKHPEEAAALMEVLRPFRRARLESVDGYQRLPALLPPPERRGLILIDPPYEAEDEFTEAAQAFAAAYKRFATGIYLIWFPIKSVAQANSFCGEVLASGATKVLRLDVERHGVPEGRLSAAGLLIVNPPWQFEETMRDALALVLPRLNAGAKFEGLTGESP